MLGNDDNSNIEINVNKGGNGMSDGTVTIARSEYKQILELAYKAAMLKDVLFANAALGYKEKSLIFVANTDLDTIAKYLFPERYAEKVEELKAVKEAESDEH